MIFSNSEPVILASASPRRQEYFRQAGIQFMVQTADIDETQHHDEDPNSYVRRMAWEKAEVVAKSFPDGWVISGDTVVSIGSRIADKPHTTSQAVAQLLELAGKTHEVRTAYSIRNVERTVDIVEVVCTEVQFWDFPESVAKAYVGTGESFDKAGGYGIQGLGGLLVAGIHGSYSNVVGFPMSDILQRLLSLGVITVAFSGVSAN